MYKMSIFLVMTATTKMTKKKLTKAQVSRKQICHLTISRFFYCLSDLDDDKKEEKEGDPGEPGDGEEKNSQDGREEGEVEMIENEKDYNDLEEVKEEDPEPPVEEDASDFPWSRHLVNALERIQAMSVKNTGPKFNFEKINIFELATGF